MTDIEQKALALVNEIERQEGLSDLTPRIMRGLVMDEALCRAIEQHEAFRQEVSDAVGAVKSLWDARDWPSNDKFEALSRFIIVKTDPLVKVLRDMGYSKNADVADDFRAALAARGLEIREKSND